MAHSVSARKRARQGARRLQRNRAVRTRLKTAQRAVAAAVRAGDAAQAEAELRRAASLLDKAARRQGIHGRKAARKKAQLARLRASLSAAPAAPAAPAAKG